MTVFTVLIKVASFSGRIIVSAENGIIRIFVGSFLRRTQRPLYFWRWAQWGDGQKETVNE